MELIGGHCWLKIRGKSSCRESAMLALNNLTVPVPKLHHDVEYRYSRVADIILQISWEISTVQYNSQSSSEYLLSSLLDACAYYTLLNRLWVGMYGPIELCTPTLYGKKASYR